MPHSVQRLVYGMDDLGVVFRLHARKDTFLYSNSFKLLWGSSGILATVCRVTGLE